MVRLVLFFVLAVVMFCATALGQDKGFGLGMILGEPTGLCLKKWVENNRALDGAVAWSFGKEDAFHLHADYLVHNFNLFTIEPGELPLYYGIGGRIKFEKDLGIGLRIPIGINYIFETAPLDVFLEIVPLLELAPATEFVLNGSIGIRYFF